MAELSFSRAQKDLCKCYELCRNPVRPALHVIREVGDGFLSLSDAELSLKELPAIHRFLQTKSALQDINTLILCKAPKEHYRKLRANTADSDLNSAFAMERGKLLRSVSIFIAKAVGIKSVVIDTIKLTPEFLKTLADALETTQSNIRSFSISNCHLGDSGMHAIFPGLAKLRMQCLRLDRCKLTDVSVPYLCSIIKGATMDAMYWNSTLRHYPVQMSRDYLPYNGAGELYSVHNSGLVALSIEANDLTDTGIEVLGRVLRKNQWILGLNLTGNRMSDQGVCAMVRAMTSNSQCVLQALLVSGNDEQGGITEVTHAALLSLTGRTVADRGRLELLPTETRKLIEKWVELQERRRTKSYNTLKQSFDEEGMSAGAGTECSEGTEDERNDLNFDFPGPPDLPETFEETHHSGTFLTAVEPDRPPSRISMRPRNSDSFHYPSTPESLQNTSRSPRRRSRSSDNMHIELASGSPQDRSLSIALALNERDKLKKKRLEKPHRSRSVSPGATGRSYRGASLMQANERNDSARDSLRRSRRDRRLSESLMSSTAASRASSYFYALPPERVVHGPEDLNDMLLQGPLRAEVDRLVAEGDKIRRQNRVECRKCANRDAAGRSRKVDPHHLHYPSSKTQIDYDARTGRVVRSRVAHPNRKKSVPVSNANGDFIRPVGQSRIERDRAEVVSTWSAPTASQRSEKPKGGKKKPKSAGVSDVMLAVSSNLREVSEQLKDITSALNESLSLSMSLRNGLTPARDRQAISPVFGGQMGSEGPATFKDSYSMHKYRAPAEMEEETDSFHDDEDKYFMQTRDSSNTETISDMIKTSIKKNLAGMFSN